MILRCEAAFKEADGWDCDRHRRPGSDSLWDTGAMKDDPKDKSSKDDDTKSGSSESDDKDDHLRPVDKKVPEGPKNLRQREEWFRKRTGS